MKKKLTWILCFLILGCSNQTEICADLIGAAYHIETYYGNQDKVSHIEYFNSNNQILRYWKPAEEIKNYVYDEYGKLIEIQYSRNCRSVIEYQYNIYSDNGLLIGEYKSENPINNLDSIEFTQTKFYSSSGKLKNELSVQNGEEIEKSYAYVNNRVGIEFIFGKDNSYKGQKTYLYNYEELLDSIVFKREDITEVETFAYDSKQRLIKKTISSDRDLGFDDPQIDAKDVIFDNKNHETIFEYKNEGKLTIESRLNKKGEVHLRIIKERHDHILNG